MCLPYVSSGSRTISFVPSGESPADSCSPGVWASLLSPNPAWRAWRAPGELAIMVSVSVSHAVAPSEVRATDWSSSPREQIVSSYGPLVRRLSRRFWASKEPPEDLFQIGVIGLLRAIDKFDPSRGSSFASLAIPGILGSILGSILNYLRDHGGPCKVPRALRSNMLAVRRASERLASQLGRWPTEAELAESCHLTERQVRDALEFGRTVDARSLDQMLGGDDGDGSGTLSERLGGEDAQFDRRAQVLSGSVADADSGEDRGSRSRRFTYRGSSAGRSPNSEGSSSSRPRLEWRARLSRPLDDRALDALPC